MEADVILQAPVFMKGFLVGYSPFRITSMFAQKRKNEYHGGIDIGCPNNTRIACPLNGVVQRIGLDKKGYGLYVVIRYHIAHADYIDIYFAHLSSRSSILNVGDKINEGQYLGMTGGVPGNVNSGRSSGAHLHLEIRHIDTQIDPIDFLMREKLVLGKTVLGNGGVYDPAINWQVWEVDFVSKSDRILNPNGKKYTVDESATEKVYEPTPSKMMGVERRAAGVWGIVKLIMDKSVSNKQIADSSIASQQGSILNFFRKVCQEPMVEFLADTYGDQFYFIVRKPPFDRKGFTDMMNLAMIEINSDDVLGTSLDWNNQGIYSWYQYMPKSQLLVSDFDLSALVPAVFFPEYASIWGSKPLCVESNYFTWVGAGKYNSDKTENKANDDNTIAAAFEDLKYIIECNAYAPFTRRGTIVLKGDRRIKKGTLVLHTSGEVFFVDKVTNEFSVTTAGITRKTTLEVSRGMYRDFINNSVTTSFDSSDNNYSYFDIIDFGKHGKITSSNWQEVMSKWKVNKDVFGYFMRKEQLLRKQMVQSK